MAHVDIEKARRQARLNKQRADRMERDIAAYLNRNRTQLARRTPQSGAGWIKGDDHVPLIHPPDFFLVSCKMTQAQNEKNQSIIRFSAKWFDELDRDINAMRSIGCKFGVLVLRWFGRAKGEYLTFVPLKYLEVIEKYMQVKLEHNGKVVDRSVKNNGAPRLLTTLIRDELLEDYHTVYKLGNHEVLIIPLSLIHEALISADKLLEEAFNEKP